MKVKKTRYSDDIWKVLQIFWESIPEITWKALVIRVAQELDCSVDDLPKTSALSRRSKLEKWTKKSKYLSKLSSKELKFLIKKLQKDVACDLPNGKCQSVDNENKNIDDCEIDNSEKSNNLVKFDEKKSDFSFTPARKLKAALIVRNARSRMYKLGNLLDATLDSVEHLREEILNMDITPETTPEEINNRVALINYKTKLISQLVGINLNQSITIANLAGAEAKYWGLEIDDLKDLEEIKASRQKSVTKSEDKLREAKERMEQKKLEALRRQDQIFEKADELARTGAIESLE